MNLSKKLFIAAVAVTLVAGEQADLFAGPKRTAQGESNKRGRGEEVTEETVDLVSASSGVQPDGGQSGAQPDGGQSGVQPDSGQSGVQADTDQSHVSLDSNPPSTSQVPVRDLTLELQAVEAFFVDIEKRATASNATPEIILSLIQEVEASLAKFGSDLINPGRIDDVKAKLNALIFKMSQAPVVRVNPVTTVRGVRAPKQTLKDAVEKASKVVDKQIVALRCIIELSAAKQDEVRAAEVSLAEKAGQVELSKAALEALKSQLVLLLEEQLRAKHVCDQAQKSLTSAFEALTKETERISKESVRTEMILAARVARTLGDGASTEGEAPLKRSRLDPRCYLLGPDTGHRGFLNPMRYVKGSKIQ